MCEDDWRPIETAPKDGTRLRAWGGGMEWHVRWTGGWTGYSVGGWILDNGIAINPTHWQPIVGPKQTRELKGSA